MSRKVIVNFSGGKDSTVAALETLKQYPKEEIVLCYQNTGADYIETPEHVQTVASMLDLPVVELKAPQDFWDRVKHRKWFPTPGLRWCTGELKRVIMEKYVRSLDSDDIVVVTGIRGEESLSRSKLPEYEANERLTTRRRRAFNWRPCLDMKVKEVYKRIQAEGLPLHCCYEFSTRCNCWLCIFAKYNEVRTYAEMHPELWEQACIVEDEVGRKWKEHFAINDLMKQGRLFDLPKGGCPDDIY